MSQVAEFVPRNVRVMIVAAFISAGQQVVLDMVSVTCPASQRSAAKKFRVIRMCQDDQDVLGFLPFSSGTIFLVFVIFATIAFAVFVFVAGRFGFSAQGFEFVPGFDVVTVEGLTIGPAAIPIEFDRDHA